MTERRFKRTQYELFERQLRKIHERREQLSKNSVLVVALEKPEFVGYEKYFVLREGCQTPLLEKLLKLVDTVLFNKTKDFTKRVRRKTRRANQEKGNKTVFLEHKPRTIEPYQWLQLSELERVYFVPQEVKSKWGSWKTVYQWAYPWMLQSKIRKKYVTHVRVPNPDVMSERAEIENRLEKYHLSHQLAKIVYGHSQSYWDYDDRNGKLEKQTWKIVRREPPFMTE